MDFALIRNSVTDCSSINVSVKIKGMETVKITQTKLTLCESLHGTRQSRPLYSHSADTGISVEILVTNCTLTLIFITKVCKNQTT